jgi:hypothetical protein
MNKVTGRRTWCVGELTVSLDTVLLNKIDYPLNLDNFLDFCRFEHNEENVNCWLEINDWKSAFDKMSEELKSQSARDITRKYIGIDATLTQVNIAERTARFLLKDEGIPGSGRIDRFRFDAAMLAVEEIIHRDIFPRFIQKVRGEVDNMRARKLALWWLHLNELKSPADLFTFPAFINEAESRLHSYLATILMIIFLLVGWFTPYWQCYYYVLYGYTMRVITGPRFCPNAWLVLFVLYPIANNYKIFTNEMVPSSPKRLAQSIGILFSLLYVVLMNYSPLAARIISIIHISVSLLAATTGFCVSCYIHHYLMSLKIHSIPSVSGGNFLIESRKQQNKVCGLSQSSVVPEWNAPSIATPVAPGRSTSAADLAAAAPARRMATALSSPRAVVLDFKDRESQGTGTKEQEKAEGLIAIEKMKQSMIDIELGLSGSMSISSKKSTAGTAPIEWSSDRSLPRVLRN